MKWIPSKQTHVCEKLPLVELLRNQLDDRKAAGVTKHLDGCEYCQRRLTDLSADATWWREAAQWLENAPTEESVAEDQLDDFSEHHGPSAESALLQSGLMKPTTTAEMIGVIGRYDIRRVIGTGGTGIVLQAVDPELDRVVAVKVLSPTLAANGPARRRFSREGQAAASVVHDNVVAIHHVESNGPIPFLVMQFIEGSSLQELVIRSGPLDVKSTLRIVAQLSSALSAAHSQGLVHRDVKPANILVGAAGQRVWITDFGLARAVDDASLTRTGFIAGTPHYMSPEQARGENVSARSDLFGLGSVMYFALTGRPPFRADRSLAILNRICNDRHRPIREVNPDVPLSVAAIVDRLLEKNPSSRFQSAEDVRNECVHLLSDSNALLESTQQWEGKGVMNRLTSRALMYLPLLLISVASGAAIWWALPTKIGHVESPVAPMALSLSSGTTFDDDLRSGSANRTPRADARQPVVQNARPSPTKPKDQKARGSVQNPQPKPPQTTIPQIAPNTLPLSESEIWLQDYHSIMNDMEKLLIHRPELLLTSEGPRVVTVGSKSSYHAALANPSDRPAENTKIVLRIPAGMQVVSSSPQARQEEDRLHWDQGILPAQQKLDVFVVLQALQPGDFPVEFTGNQETTDSVVRTRVMSPAANTHQQFSPVQSDVQEPLNAAPDQELFQIDQQLRVLELLIDENNSVDVQQRISS